MNAAPPPPITSEMVRHQQRPERVADRCRLADVLCDMGIDERDLHFYTMRLRQIGCDPETTGEDEMRLHISTFKTMFKAHSQDPYGDDD